MTDPTQQASGGPTQHRFDSRTRKLSHDYLEPAMDSMNRAIAHRPISSVLTILGAGVVVGIILGMSLGGSRRGR
jgi:hypothetical protein